MQVMSIRTSVKQIAEVNRLIAKNQAQILLLSAVLQHSQSLLQDLNGHGKISSSARREIRSLTERVQRLRENSLRLIERSRKVASTIRCSK